MKSNKVIGTLLVGAATGAVVGLLLAPEKGSRTRDKLYQKGTDIADDVEKRLQKLNKGIKKQIEESRRELAEMAGNGNWLKARGKLRKKLSALTGDNTMFAKGKRDEMLSKLSSKLGKSKEELEDIISEL